MDNVEISKPPVSCEGHEKANKDGEPTDDVGDNVSVVSAQTSVGVHVAAVCMADPIQSPPCDVTIVVADNDGI